MIKFTTHAKKDCAAATAKLAEAGAPLFRETDPKRIQEKANKRLAAAKRAARKSQ